MLLFFLLSFGLFISYLLVSRMLNWVESFMWDSNLHDAQLPPAKKYFGQHLPALISLSEAGKDMWILEKGGIVIFVANICSIFLEKASISLDMSQIHWSFSKCNQYKQPFSLNSWDICRDLICCHTKSYYGCVWTTDLSMSVLIVLLKVVSIWSKSKSMQILQHSKAD